MAASGDARRAFQALFSAAVARWTSGEADGDYTLAWPAFRAGVLAAWNELASETAEEIWVVSSGGPIAVIAALLAGADLRRTFDFAWPLVNTSVSRIRTGWRGAQLVTYNAWSHLDTTADASLVTYR
ncbi:MAG: histidine phosphatase family protein [Burkholderia sp.]